jgi:hypothetical protein
VSLMYPSVRRIFRNRQRPHDYSRRESAKLTVIKDLLQSWRQTALYRSVSVDNCVDLKRSISILQPRRTFLIIHFRTSLAQFVCEVTTCR